MVFGQKWPFLQLLFLKQNRPGKCLLRYSRTKKNPFQAIKTRSSKSKKIVIILNELTHCFCTKMAISPNSFFFRQNRPGKCLLRYCRTKKTHPQPIKTRSLKILNIAIFPKGLTHGFGPKRAICSTSFFLANIGQESVFDDILERKKAFLGFKNEKFENSKIGIFAKRLTHGFGPKMAICPTSFFQAKQAR